MLFKFLSSKRFYRPLIAAGLFFAAFVLLVRGIQPVKYDIAPGGISPADIYAHRDVVDKVATERQKAAAAEKVPPQYTVNSEIATRAERDLAEVLLWLEGARRGEENGEGARQSAVIGRVAGESMGGILALDAAQFNRLKTIISKVQRDLMTNGVSGKDEALEKAAEDLEKEGIPQNIIPEALSILRHTLAENKTLNERATEQERERARNAVGDVVYKTNQVIVRRGEVIGPGQFQMLTDLGLVRGEQSVNYKLSLGIFVLLLMICALIFLLIKKRREKRNLDDDFYLITGLILLLQIVIIFLSRGVEGARLYLVPTAVGTILIALIFDADIALLINAVFAVLSGIVLNGDTIYICSALIMGGFGIFAFSTEGMRRNLVYSALAFSAATAAVFFIMGLIGGIDVVPALIRAGYGAINGVITSVFIIGSLPFWEITFDIITPFKLVDLSNPNQKLLKRLLLEAPGTYHHSLMVGNLAEAAAGAVGANALLARVGAYYHDIGKLKRPVYFTENQIGENPHDSLPPEQSAGIIMSHIKDSVAMAKQFRLPRKVREIIESHHGATYTVFFLHKAKESGAAFDAEKFKYPGPLPTSKEAAIVMLADSVEASVRATKDKGKEEIGDIIKRIINDRLTSGQLSQSELTIRDLGIIASEFEKILSGYFHERIKYPPESGAQNG